MAIKGYKEVDFYKEMVKKLEAINLIFFEIHINENAYYSIAWNDNIPQPLPNYLNYLCHLHTKVTTIETNKLINHKENFSIYNLFTFIHQNDLDRVFDLNKLNHFKSELKECKKIINDITKLRTKRYAHLDHDYKEVGNFFAQREFRELFKTIKDIVDYLNTSFNLAPHLRYNSFKGYLFADYYDTVFKKLDLNLI
ncbi:hypothetical protein [Sphingobacterium hotanense]|uniref:HEPN AbiU2-like domain-containing protein n=1 Tax=Sphingobacterium hotanense TaxID=649196 RepID=A0ABT7NQ22_9SPHI|nr:hypothetical protein [Sphingobacterium hotanense]MDM1049360.1 hypothetical protein [Sphingobacterium hotanense]